MPARTAASDHTGAGYYSSGSNDGFDHTLGPAMTPPAVAVSGHPRRQPHQREGVQYSRPRGHDRSLSGSNRGTPRSAPLSPTTSPTTAGPAEKRIAKEVSVQIGVEVDAVFASIAGAVTSFFIIIQLGFIAARVDGQMDWDWDNVFAPLWVFDGFLILMLVWYFLSGSHENEDSDIQRREFEVQRQLHCFQQNAELGDSSERPTVVRRACESRLHKKMNSFCGSNDDVCKGDTAAGSSASSHAGSTPATTASSSAANFTSSSSSGSANSTTVLTTRASIERDMARLETLRVANLRFRRITNVAWTTVVVAYVIATALAGRLMSHPTKYTAWVAADFAFFAEVVLICARIAEYVILPPKDQLWLRFGYMDLSLWGTVVMAALRFSTPVARILFAILMLLRCEDGCPHGGSGPHYLVVGIPLLWLIFATAVATFIKVETSVRNGHSTRRVSIFIYTVVFTVLACFLFTVIATAFKLQEVWDVSLGLCFAPLFVIFSALLFATVCWGYIMASRKHEMPNQQLDDEEDASREHRYRQRQLQRQYRTSAGFDDSYDGHDVQVRGSGAPTVDKKMRSSQLQRQYSPPVDGGYGQGPAAALASPEGPLHGATSAYGWQHVQQYAAIDMASYVPAAATSTAEADPSAAEEADSVDAHRHIQAGEPQQERHTYFEPVDHEPGLDNHGVDCALVEGTVVSDHAKDIL